MDELEEAGDCPFCRNPLISSSSYSQPESPHQHRRIHMASKKRKGGNKKKGYGR